MKPRKLPVFPPWDFFVLVVKVLTLPDRLNKFSLKEIYFH